MKKIRIKICGYDPNNAFSYGKKIISILERNFNIELSDEPDYVFCHESNTEYLNHDCIRILYTGENIHPNFNLFDYAISFDHIDFGDRHFRLPVFQMAIFYNEDDVKNAGDLDFKEPRLFTKEDLQAKTGFCSFVYSNYLADPTRETFFDLLSEYKPVNSGGRLRNNIGSPVDSKLDFELKHKFSIAFENSSRDGYTTEKILCSFAANTIPIYNGDPRVAEIFNPERFINCADYPDFQSVVKRVTEIDQDDELYLSIINKPVLNPDIDFAKDRDDFAAFLTHIFDQPLVKARRRHINPARAHTMEQNERMIAVYQKVIGKLKNIFAKLYTPFKKIPFLESAKIKFFRKIST